MRECRGNGRRPAIAAAPQPDAKLTHQGGHVARCRCREDHVALSVSDRIRSAAVRTGREEWVNIVEHESVDVPHEPLVEPDLLVARDLVDEAQRLLSREDSSASFRETADPAPTRTSSTSSALRLFPSMRVVPWIVRIQARWRNHSAC